MANPHFPDNFTTELPPGSTVIEIHDANGWLLNATALRHLADKLLLGRPVDRSERAVAGAAIGHLLALHSGISAVSAQTPDGGPCAVCGKPHKKHGSYPTCSDHPYTPTRSETIGYCVTIKRDGLTP